MRRNVDDDFEDTSPQRSSVLAKRLAVWAGFECVVQGAGFRVPGSGFRVPGSGFRAWRQNISARQNIPELSWAANGRRASENFAS